MVLAACAGGGDSYSYAYATLAQYSCCRPLHSLEDAVCDEDLASDLLDVLPGTACRKRNAQ